MPLQDIGPYTIKKLQILDEKGNVDKELMPDLSDAKLLHLYKSMVFAREADDRMLKLQRQGRIGTFPPCVGQEAAVCGPAMAMADGDWLVPAFREVGARMMRGEPLHKLLLYYNGYEEGCYTEGKPRVLPVYVIISSQMLHAVGIGYAHKYRGEKDATVCFFGDGGTSEGDFHEGLNFASVWKTPSVFICQNNQWAISVPLEKQTASRTIAQKGLAYDMPSYQVDGNDALAMYQATKWALERARSGEGPTFIEAVTYRLKMHTTADDPTKYRTEAEVQPWLQREPLTRFRLFLTARGVWSDAKEAALWEEAKKHVEGEVKTFEDFVAAPLKLDTPFEHVWGTGHEVLRRQHEEFNQYLEWHRKQQAAATGQHG
ncbi:MAG: pyruvate dehydrogenase (acetyl-transferring) E1 component subunit alpha [Planctomycetota bacterium]